MNTLDLIKRNPVREPVVELGSPGRFMAGSPGCCPQRPTGPELFSDPGSSEAMSVDLCGQALGPPLNHGRRVLAGQRPAGELVGPPPRAADPKGLLFRIGGRAGPLGAT